MKHCLKQREKIEKKFTFVTKGNDGPWKNDEVTIKFHKETKNKNDHHDIINIKSNKNIISNNDNKFNKSINYKNKLNTFNKKDETSIYEPFLNNVLDEYDNCK